MAIDKAVTSLPLEFRGNDPTLRKNVETVIETLMEANGRGLKSMYFRTLYFEKAGLTNLHSLGTCQATGRQSGASQ